LRDVDIERSTFTTPITYPMNVLTTMTGIILPHFPSVCVGKLHTHTPHRHRHTDTQTHRHTYTHTHRSRATSSQVSKHVHYQWELEGSTHHTNRESANGAGEEEEQNPT
jgi:hypothetical protein